MLSRLALPVLALCLTLPCAALAGEDEVVVSSSQAAKSLPKADPAKAEAQPVTATLADPTQTVAWLNEASKGSRPARDVTNSAPASDSNFLSKHGIHGSMGASIGTGGYSSAYISALIPVGDDGMLGIAVSQTDFGNNSVVGYPGYGYGAYGHGYPGNGYGQRGGRAQAFGLSYQSGFGDNRSDTPDGCAPGFRHDGHYIEPLWVSRMHANGSAPQACDASEDDQY